jgi:hypothetical protein
MRSPISWLILLCLFPVIHGCALFEKDSVQLSLDIPFIAAEGVPLPVHAGIELPEGWADVPLDEIAVELEEAGGDAVVPGQLVRGPNNDVELWWVVPARSAKSGTRWTAVLKRSPGPAAKGFAWKDAPAKHLDLLFNGRKVVRHMYAFDPSTEGTLHETYKPFLHVFDRQGRDVITKGSGGLYTHHRGIFIGWNRLTFENKEYDFWHMKGVVQKHEKFLEEIAGPIMARSKSLIHWNYKENTPLIEEEREITIYRQPEPSVLLLDFSTRLTAVRSDVFLNGDPEHGGFQFRPHNDLAEGPPEVKATYLFDEDGIDPKKDQDLPWAAETFLLREKRYAVQHMNHPENPRDTVYSAYRDYGRFP